MNNHNWLSSLNQFAIANYTLGVYEKLYTIVSYSNLYQYFYRSDICELVNHSTNLSRLAKTTQCRSAVYGWEDNNSVLTWEF